MVERKAHCAAAEVAQEAWSADINALSKHWVNHVNRNMGAEVSHNIPILILTNTGLDTIKRP